MYFVYILLSKKDNKLYIGFSEDVHSRFEKHCSGSVKATKRRRPLELIYYEAYLDKRDAEGREIFLKSGSGHRFIRKQLKYFFEIRFRGVEQPGSSQGS
ncbi:MAG: GIY-YIG nuclease family protein [Candidatus Omnitrophota bacterium]